MAGIPSNPRRVGYIVPIHEPLYMSSIYTNTCNFHLCKQLNKVFIYDAG